MSKNPKTSSDCLKATFDSGKDTEKRKILVKPKLISPDTVKVSLWDQDFEIGTIVCPVEWYVDEYFFKAILDKVLMGYSRSLEFQKVHKRKEANK